MAVHRSSSRTRVGTQTTTNTKVVAAAAIVLAAAAGFVGFAIGGKYQSTVSTRGFTERVVPGYWPSGTIDAARVPGYVPGYQAPGYLPGYRISPPGYRR